MKTKTGNFHDIGKHRHIKFRQIAFCILFICIFLNTQKVFSNTKIEGEGVIHYATEQMDNIHKANPKFADQQIKVSGTVTDSNGDPITGATVTVKGLFIGTTTDSNGYFELNIPSDAEVLQVSFVGMITEEIEINGKTKFGIVLKTDAIGLDEVVAIGYGSVKKKDLTGAAASLSSENLMQGRPIVSLEDALKGKVSGMRVIQNQGGPGAESSVTIRGATSLEGDSNPLYIVDGFPSPNFDMNAADIASVDVLKDAASTAIYGSRGANGVIIITTKSADSNVPVIKASAKYGITKPAKKIDMLNSSEYAKQMYHQVGAYTRPGDWNMEDLNKTEKEYFVDQEGGLYDMRYFVPGESGRIYPYRNYQDYEHPDSTNTDWQDEVLNSAVFQDYNFSFSKRTVDKSSYLLSFNYVDQEGIILGNDYNKIVGRINLKQQMGDKIRLENNTSFVNSTNEGLTTVTNQMLRLPPLRDPRGMFFDPNKPGTSLDEAYFSSPLDLADMVDRYQNTSIFNSSLALNIELLKELNLNVGGSYRLLSSGQENYDHSQTIYGYAQGGMAQIVNTENQNFNFNGLLNYNKIIADDHQIDAMVGMAIDLFENNFYRSETWGFDIELLKYWGMSNATDPQLPDLSLTESALQSYFGRLNYIFKDKYLFKATVRADGASKFSRNEKWGYFPSVATAWRISEESFLKDISWFPLTKLRASWGIVGKQTIAPYQSLAAMQGSVTTIDGESRYTGVYKITDERPDLRWETNSEIDFGIDLIFKGGRYSFTADVYRKDTEDLLLFAATPSYSGYTSVLQNIGSLRNEGVEIQFGGTPVEGKFVWTSDFNISFVRSEVLDIGEDSEMFIPNGVVRVGEPIGQWFGYETDGIWNSMAEILEAKEEGFISQHAQSVDGLAPGLTRYKDQLTVDTDGDGIPDAGDGIINADDRVVLGRAAPNIMGGWFNTFSYKGFSLSVGLQYSLNSLVFNENKINLTTGRGGSNQYGETRDRWYPKLYQLSSPDTENGYDYTADYDPSDPATWGPLHDEGSDSNKWRGSYNTAVEQFLDDRYIEDGSFLRLSDVTLAYTLPKLISKSPIRFVKIYASARNLAIWTNYTGYDPEVNNGNYKAILPGLDNGAYPRERSIIFGIDLTF